MPNLWMFYVITAARVITGDAVQITASFSDSLNVTISCKSETPLTLCNFKTWIQNDSYSGNGTTISLRSESVGNENNSVNKYASLHSDSKTCEISLNLKIGQYLIGCRTKEKNANWVYNFTALFVNGHYQIQESNVTFENVPQGTNVTVDWKVPNDSKLSECVFWFLGNLRVIATNSNNNSCNRKLTYQFCKSECGCNLTLFNVDKASIGGPVFRKGRVNANFDVFAANIIIVQDEPEQHQMPVAPPVRNQGARTLQARCIVKVSTTKIIWLLGDQIVRNDSTYEIEEWTWPWETKTVIQILKLNVTDKDNGKTLMCKVTHQYMNTESVFYTSYKIGGLIASSPLLPNGDGFSAIAAGINILLLAVLVAVTWAAMRFIQCQATVFSFVPRVLPPERTLIVVENSLYFNSAELVETNVDATRAVVNIPLVEFVRSQEIQDNERNSFLYSSPENPYETVDDNRKTVAEVEYNYYESVKDDFSPAKEVSPEDSHVFQETQTSEVGPSDNRETVFYDEIVNSPGNIPPLPDTS